MRVHPDPRVKFTEVPGMYAEWKICGRNPQRHLGGAKGGYEGNPYLLCRSFKGEDTKIKVLKVIRGAQPYIEFKQAFDSLLQK
jgi:hypothetical protein